MHEELLALEFGVDDFRGDSGPGDNRLADLHAVGARDAQDAVEGDFGPFRDAVPEIDLEDLSFFHAILLTTIGNDGVHLNLATSAG